jgi:hypothetical protein
MITRVYADTSVFGGAFDAEFQRPTQAFLEQVRQGLFNLVSSAVVGREIEVAPPHVRASYDDLISLAEIVDVTEEALALRSAYLEADIVGQRCSDDALHVALATVSRCPLIVSWNFKHIVHQRKIPLYNAVNVLRGFSAIAIHSPAEVIEYDE